jgi:hypothetical protein
MSCLSNPCDMLLEEEEKDKSYKILTKNKNNIA